MKYYSETKKKKKWPTDTCNNMDINLKIIILSERRQKKKYILYHL